MEKTELENCGPGCDCGKSSGNTKAKVIACLIVLLAVGTILAYKANSTSQTAPSNAADVAFAAPLLSQNTGGDSTAAQTTTVPSIDAASPAETVPPVGQDETVLPETDLQQAVKTATAKKKFGDFVDSLSSLNKLAANQDAVFVFLPAKADTTVAKDTDEAVAAVKRTLESQKIRIGLYTLQSGSPEYSNIAAQLSLPGMLVLSKGRGMGVVSGEITEAKLLQAYVASTRAGGCGPSGCGPSGCN